jgi:hypothetical protein
MALESPDEITSPEKNKGYKYDVIAVLNGGIRKHRKGWRTTNYSESDDYGSLGSRARMIAAGHLFQKGDLAENFFVTTGKTNYLENEPDAPGESEVAKEELVKRGIPEENIFLENESKNTKQGIIGILKAALGHGWKKILILSSDYHMPRVKALCEKIVAENGDYEAIDIDYQGAETFLTEVNPKWKKYIEQANNLEGMKTRIENEEKGLRDLESGSYRSVQEKQHKKAACEELIS